MRPWDAEAPWQAPDDAADYTVLLVFLAPRLDRFVLARHRARGWELPGGRVEPGESLLAAARREWQEETALPLTRLEPLLLHERPDGSRGHLFLGAIGTSALPPSAGPKQDDDEKIEEVRPVRALQEVAPLAFPDDPYERIADEVWKRGDTSEWERVPGETRAAFVARLSVHPEARPKGHRVVPHPARSDAQG